MIRKEESGRGSGKREEEGGRENDGTAKPKGWKNLPPRYGRERRERREREEGGRWAEAGRYGASPLMRFDGGAGR